MVDALVGIQRTPKHLRHHVAVLKARRLTVGEVTHLGRHADHVVAVGMWRSPGGLRMGLSACTSPTLRKRLACVWQSWRLTAGRSQSATEQMWFTRRPIGRCDSTSPSLSRRSKCAWQSPRASDSRVHCGTRHCADTDDLRDHGRCEVRQKFVANKRGCGHRSLSTDCPCQISCYGVCCRRGASWASREPVDRTRCRLGSVAKESPVYLACAS